MMDECIAAVTSILALHGWTLLLITAAALVAYLVTLHYIPAAAQTLFSRNLYGIDMNKTTAAERAEFATLRATQGHDGIARDARFAARAIPESLGILAGAVFLCVLTLLIVLLEGRDTHTMAGAITTITVMLLLGFVDDVLDVRWRHKIFLSALGSLAFILAYRGSLYVLVPPALTRAALTLAGMDVRDAEAMWSLRSATSFSSSSLSAASGELPIYAMWMEEINSFLQDPFAWLLQHNCIAPSGSGTSSITLVLYLGPLYLLYQMLLCIFCTNSINILAGINGLEVGQSLVIAAASVLHNLVQLRPQDHATTASSSPTTDASLRALMLLGPFMGVSAALWRYNRYPATIFVGDSFTYFAGTVLAVAAITGVYGKTLMLFFVPQLINFIISLPQLFGLVVCPRHRVPTWVKERDVLHNSGNYTLLNAILLVTGDLTEKQLTRVVLGLQIITCAMGFVLRYLVASFLYDHVE